MIPQQDVTKVVQLIARQDRWLECSVDWERADRARALD
jgi:hypothetical protein